MRQERKSTPVSPSSLNQQTRIYRKHKLFTGYDCAQDLSIIYAPYHISGASVADMVVVCPLTGGFCQSQSLCPWARHFLHPHCLLMVVRGLGGADCMAHSLLSVCPRGAMATM
ncbi:hypothetical protein AMECASPLE_026918 [Ameca splendens]|uniref:Uncharacterized protein n=1 Tax=Ameca splendens TaxID=208324 RepID=A0ABV0YS26_9TELE